MSLETPSWSGMHHDLICPFIAIHADPAQRLADPYGRRHQIPGSCTTLACPIYCAKPAFIKVCLRCARCSVAYLGGNAGCGKTYGQPDSSRSYRLSQSRVSYGQQQAYALLSRLTACQAVLPVFSQIDKLTTQLVSGLMQTL